MVACALRLTQQIRQYRTPERVNTVGLVIEICALASSNVQVWKQRQKKKPETSTYCVLAQHFFKDKDGCPLASAEK